LSKTFFLQSITIMKFLGAYAILATTVFGEGDVGGPRTVTFDGAALSSLAITTESYALTQTSQVTIPIATASWSTVSALAGTIESTLKTEMETAITAQCTSFTTDFPQYTFTLAAGALTYTETFTSPNVIINFSVGVDAVYEVQTVNRKRRAVVTSADVSTDVKLRITELVDAAATAFAASASSFSGMTDGSATISTDSTGASADIEVDACVVSPCAGSISALTSCTDIRGSDSTTAGRVCEVDACVDNPCHSDASINAGYTCTDIAGEDITNAGRTCVDNVCASETCNGRGVCFETQCTCNAFTPSATEILDPASSNCATTACASPCLNGGMCLEIGGAATCSCGSASAASSTTQALDLNSSDCGMATCSTECANGGICVMGASAAECDCNAATYNPASEIRDTSSTSCAAAACPGTCENNGVCTDVSSTATCVCHVESGFPGSFFQGSVCADFNYATMVAKIVELNTKDATIDQAIADGVVAADAKVAVVDTRVTDVAGLVGVNAAAIVTAEASMAAKIVADLAAKAVVIASETDAKIAVVDTKVTDVDGLVNVNAAAIVAAEASLAAKIDADLAAQAIVIASETDAKIEIAKTDLQAQITSNDDEIALLTSGQVSLAASIQTNVDSIIVEVAAREAADVLLNARVDGEIADIAANAAAVAAEAVTRDAADVVLGGRIDSELSDIAANSASIQANTDADATFRSFNWKSGVQSIYNMVSATNLADLITEKETLEDLIDAPADVAE
jgi:hypothetical protein